MARACGATLPWRTTSTTSMLVTRVVLGLSQMVRQIWYIQDPAAVRKTDRSDPVAEMQQCRIASPFIRLCAGADQITPGPAYSHVCVRDTMRVRSVRYCTAVNAACRDMLCGKRSKLAQSESLAKCSSIARSFSSASLARFDSLRSRMSNCCQNSVHCGSGTSVANAC